ncbi:flagellar protein flio [Modestobacter sp. I12A-02628]|uniref:Flagellar biosynthetic protein FliO n=2 Tax=Goekera deserti TaxID=2497753 RepID=A0A7K3WGD2_9ACTN|nr:flagellar protein flio [Goekera deserti]NDI48975.1 flagellar protein flio [Goekera deserti]NEL55555.1 flagellar biosynthetic protein FliO [Goekera deserti]
MIIRLVLSLAFVAGVLLMAARVAKKRGLGGGGSLIEVLASQRMGRSSNVSVLRIGERVLVVGATDQQITLLGEMDPDAVDEALASSRPARSGADDDPDDSDDYTDGDLLPAPRRTPARHSSGITAGSVLDRAAWGSMVSELRERTVRR